MARTVLISGKRTAIGRFLGGLSAIPATDLGAHVAKAVLEETQALRAGVDEVFVGNVLQAGVGQNPARQVALKAGLPPTVTAVTLNKVCGSGLEAVMQADRAIRAGDIQVALCGGIESMSLAPHLLLRSRTGTKFGDIKLVDHMIADGLTCAFENWAMGCAADYIAEKHGVSREAQDEFAYHSHLRASAATREGRFRDEIVPFPTRKGDVAEDETIRHEVSLDALASLSPVFTPNGTVTAGNASSLSDGAAMVLAASDEAAKRHGWTPMAEVLSIATAGVEPKDLFIAPVHAVRLAVERAGLTLADIDLFEINEAFAAQMLACLKGLELDSERVNVNGGAIALGHPIGASGTRVLVTLLHAMKQRDARTGCASLCLGGGNAVAVVVRRP